MKRSLAIKTIMTVVALGIAFSARANLLTNGSFESGTFTPDANQTQTFTAGATTMTGWTTTGNFVSWIGAGNPFGLLAQDGSFLLDLTGYHAGAPFGGVTQTIATTVGQQYVLSFYLGSYTSVWGGPPVSIAASAGGTSATFTDSAAHAASTWTPQQLVFTASAAATAITLTGSAGNNYIGLDNVSVEACTPGAAGCGSVPSVPVPGTLGLLALGVLGLGALRRN